MSKGLFILLVGSSGSGKNTIINNIIKKQSDIKFLVSNTSREMRPYEKDGETYNFVSKEEFERAIKNNEMLEYDITHKGYYGISKKTIDETLKKHKVVMKDITVLGAINCKNQLSKKVNILTIFLTESKSTLKKRLIQRGEKNYKLRLKIYNKEQSQMTIGDYIIKNTHLEETIEKINAIINYYNNNTMFELLQPISNIKINKVKKYIKQIKNGVQLKPVEVALIGDKIAIIKGVNEYLASLSTGKSISKKFVNNTDLKNFDFATNQEKWQEIIKVYKNNKM